MNLEQVFKVIRSMTGSNNVVSTSVMMVDLTGSWNAAHLLSQLLYWSDKTKNKDGWIYKTYAEWHEEIRLSEYQVRQAAKELVSLGLIEREVHRANGVPTLHYRVIPEAVVNGLVGLVSNHGEETSVSDTEETSVLPEETSVLPEETSGSDTEETSVSDTEETSVSDTEETSEPLTEITTEITTENTTETTTETTTTAAPAAPNDVAAGLKKLTELTDVHKAILYKFAMPGFRSVSQVETIDNMVQVYGEVNVLEVFTWAANLGKPMGEAIVICSKALANQAAKTKREAATREQIPGGFYL